MKTFAKYNYMQLPDEVANAVIEAGIELSKIYGESIHNKSVSVAERNEYDKKNKDFNETLIKYCIESSGVAKYSGLSDVKNPMIYRNPAFINKFAVVLAQIVTPVTPAVVSSEFSTLAEVKQIGWGDTARFVVKSNDLFMVNDLAEGIRMGGLQRLYNNEITVNPTPKQIRFDMPFYLLAAGVFDWGEWVYKVGISFGAYINALIMRTFSSVVANYTSVLSPYVATGFSDANWDAIVQRVSAANGGSQVYALGTLTTLGRVLPATPLQYELGEEHSSQGFLTMYHGARLVPFSPILVPGTTNTTAQLAIPDGTIYFIGMNGSRPVKVVFEGENVVVETIPTETSDKVQGMAVTIRMGVASVVGSRFGAITGIA